MDKITIKMSINCITLSIVMKSNKMFITMDLGSTIMESPDIERFSGMLNEGAGVASAFFAPHREALVVGVETEMARASSSGEWNRQVAAAAEDLERWSQGGRKQVYTPEKLAEARLAREVANNYEADNLVSLQIANGLHQVAVTCAFVQNRDLFDSLVSEGREGRKLGLVELADRLGPALQPAGSSAYYIGKYVPYAIESREIFGEVIEEGVKLVTPEVARAGARNLVEKLGAHYALAETSAAPRADVPRSGRKPEVHICTYVNGSDPVVKSYGVDVSLRTEFDSRVREEMYNSLRGIFESGS
jgi:hypothetical protein